MGPCTRARRAERDDRCRGATAGAATASAGRKPAIEGRREPCRRGRRTRDASTATPSTPPSSRSAAPAPAAWPWRAGATAPSSVACSGANRQAAPAPAAHKPGQAADVARPAGEREPAEPPPAASASAPAHQRTARRRARTARPATGATTHHRAGSSAAGRARPRSGVAPRGLQQLAEQEQRAEQRRVGEHARPAAATENARHAKNRGGSIGAGARRSQATKPGQRRRRRGRARAASCSTSAHTSASSPAPESASPGRSSRPSGPWLSLSRRRGERHAGPAPPARSPRRSSARRARRMSTPPSTGPDAAATAATAPTRRARRRGAPAAWRR